MDSDLEDELHERIRQRLESMPDEDATRADAPSQPLPFGAGALVAVLNSLRSPIQLGALVSILITVTVITFKLGKFW